MKHLIFISLVLWSCASLPSGPELLGEQYPVDYPSAYMVQPFFDTATGLINTGSPWDEQLRNITAENHRGLESKIRAELERVPVEVLYIFSTSLYNLGYKDKALYWFYTAQLYDKVFDKIMDRAVWGRIGNRTFELSAAFQAFHELGGIWINGFSAGNIDRKIAILKLVMGNRRVMDYSKVYPKAEFAALDQAEALHRQTAENLQGYLDYLDQNREEIQRIRAENGIEGRY
jgi:hypothetical protein